MNIIVKLDQGTSSLGCKMGQTMLKQWLGLFNNKIGHLDSFKDQSKNLIIAITQRNDWKIAQEQFEDNLIFVIKLKGTQIPQQHLLALSGHLKTFGQNPEKPFIPKYLTDVVAAISICLTAFPIIANTRRLLRNKTKLEDLPKISVKELDIVQCLKYFGTFNITSVKNSLINPESLRGQNILDGGAPFYQIYSCKNGTKLTIGNIEAKFQEQMLDQLDISQKDKEFCSENHMNFEEWPKIRSILSEKFKQKTAEEWEAIMEKRDTCVIAVRTTKRPQGSYLHPIYSSMGKL